jgi:hypothetical protein
MVKLVKKITKTANKVGLFIAFLVNSVLLLAVYLIGVGSTFVVAKLVGKKFIELTPSKGSFSYWNDLNLRKKRISRYYKQF